MEERKSHYRIYDEEKGIGFGTISALGMKVVMFYGRFENYKKHNFEFCCTVKPVRRSGTEQVC